MRHAHSSVLWTTLYVAIAAAADFTHRSPPHPNSPPSSRLNRVEQLLESAADPFSAGQPDSRQSIIPHLVCCRAVHTANDKGRVGGGAP